MAERRLLLPKVSLTTEKGRRTGAPGVAIGEAGTEAAVDTAEATASRQTWRVVAAMPCSSRELPTLG